MNNNQLSPHDHFFRRAMENPNTMREFFQKHLPDNIKSIVNFKTIKPQKDSFIDDQLKLQISDLLFSAEFNQTAGYFYLLIEHQSTPQKFMPFRLLKYMIAIMEHHLEKNKSPVGARHAVPLPIVYPMIFYTGQKKYGYSTDLFDLFDDKKLAKDIFLNPFQLVDLSKYPDEEFQAFLWYGVLARVMKHIAEKDFLPTFKNVVIDLKQLENKGELRYIYTVLTYVFNVGDLPNEEQFREVIQTELSDVDERQFMTLAEKYRQKGYQEGKQEAVTLAEQYRQEGRQKGIQAGMRAGIQEGYLEAVRTIALEQLKQGFSIEQVIKTTHLTLAEIEQLQKQTH
jgi:predicted transposase/invertase (TIGR01784 family)